MLNGRATLNLMMGPAVPIPVGRDIVEALTSVQVTNAAGQASGFQLSFQFNSKSALNQVLILMGNIGPVIRTVVIVTVKGFPHVLMDGTISHQQVSSDATSGKTTLTLTGTDLTGIMNLIPFTGLPYPAMPPAARVLLILAKYAAFGMVPLVIPSVFPEVPNPLERIPTHQGTDLAYLNALAAEVGYTFFVEPGPVPGANVAYFGPDIKAGPLQPTLRANLDTDTNVESLSFDFDGRKRTLPVIFIQNQETRAPIPIPIPADISPLNPPLGLIPPLPSKIKMMRDTANKSPIQAVMLGLAEASKTADAVSGKGSLKVAKYGHILKSRMLVGVKGAGEAFDGLYYVKTVTHKIQRGEYTQDFVLVRNGLRSTIPQLPN